MKRYQFRLNRVLDVRLIEEKIAQNKLLQERHKANLIEDKLRTLNEKQQNIYNYLRKDKKINQETLQVRNFLYRHRRTIDEVEHNLDEQLEEVEECNSIFIKKKMNKEILEKLKEKDFQKYQKELLRKEQKLIDEMNHHIIEVR